jgi:alpha-glucosidase (family GH31 glycosyl hydrolase)
VEEAYTRKDEYKFGENMIVSPVVEPADKESHLSAKDIWLPSGEWVEWQTGARLTGPGIFHRTFTVSQIPVYVKAGSIIPMQPEMSYTGEKPVDPLIFEVLPFGANQKSSSYSVYEDSGKGESYTRGEFARTNIEIARVKKDEYEVTIAAAAGSYAGMLEQRAYEVRFDGAGPAKSVMLDGHKVDAATSPDGVGWRYDAASRQLFVRLPSQSTHAVAKVRVRLMEGDAGLASR